MEVYVKVFFSKGTNLNIVKKCSVDKKFSINFLLCFFLRWKSDKKYQKYYLKKKKDNAQDI